MKDEDHVVLIYTLTLIPMSDHSQVIVDDGKKIQRIVTNKKRRKAYNEQAKNNTRKHSVKRRPYKFSMANKEYLNTFTQISGQRFYTSCE